MTKRQIADNWIQCNSGATVTQGYNHETASGVRKAKRQAAVASMKAALAVNNYY